MSVYSIHIACSQVDETKYPIALNVLPGSIPSAKLMKKELEKLHPGCHSSLYENPTVDQVLAALKKVSDEAHSGDLVIFHYIGHGAQIPTTQGDNATAPEVVDGETNTVDGAGGKFQCTLLLNDRMMVSNEYRTAIAKFRAGIRFVNFIDACDSGTEGIRVVDGHYKTFRKHGAKPIDLDIPNFISMAIPADLFTQLYDQNPALYDEKAREPAVNLRIEGVHFCPCRDGETTGQAGPLGNAPAYSYFTDTVISQLRSAKPPATYKELQSAVQLILAGYGSPHPVLIHYAEGTAPQLLGKPFQ